MTDYENKKTNESQINVLAGTQLIPWAHGYEEDLTPTISRVESSLSSKNQNLLSIDSIRPSNLRITNETLLTDLIGSSNPEQVKILNSLSGNKEIILLGSDPLSFMILNQEMLNEEEAVKMYAAITASLVAGGSSTEFILRKLSQRKTNLSRRDFLRLSLIGTFSTLAGVGGRLGYEANQNVDRVLQAEQLSRGQGVGNKNRYGNRHGIDERTLLDALKHEKTKKYLSEAGLITTDQVQSVSVWGNDHFLTDNYKQLQSLAKQAGIAEKYVEKGNVWLEKVLPEARKIFIDGGGSEASFEQIVKDLYFDLEYITIVRLLNSDADSKAVVPVLTNETTNYISLLN